MENTLLLIMISMIILLGAMFGFKTQKEQIILNREEWHCIKSLMVDTNNVDKVECILYAKQEIQNDSE